MSNNELINKITQKAVMPELERRFHHAIGIVMSTRYEPTDTKKEGVPVCNVLIQNPYTGGTTILYDVPIQAFSPTAKVNSTTKEGNYVRVQFLNGKLETPVLTDIVPSTEVKDGITRAVAKAFGLS